MKVKYLSDVKKCMAEKKPFYIVNHRVSNYIGQSRVANIVQTNGMYSVVQDKANDPVSLANGGKGSWLLYGRATDWEIDDLTGHCTLYSGEHIPENMVWEIVFFDEPLVKQKYSLLKMSFLDGTLRREEAAAVISASSKKMMYRCGYAWKGAEKKPILKEEALSVVDSADYLDITETEDEILLNVYTGTDMW